MRILTTLYYYRPHYSGLTVYTERLARALASRGHQVTVLTSRYDSTLPKEEQLDGVSIQRVGVLAIVSKGPIMPTFLWHALRLARGSDVLHVHVPQLDAAPIALIGKLLGKPVVVTYHCDLSLPPTPLNRLANWMSSLANRITLSLASAIVTNTADYALHSPSLWRAQGKIVVIPPPTQVAQVDARAVAVVRQAWGLKRTDKVIGMAARLATEKGVEVLAQAMPRILQAVPQARVVYVGQYQHVMGETAYFSHLAPQLQSLGDRWQFLGVLDENALAAFYHLCDVTVLPSLNSTESFGMVQVESMLCGTPVIASDLPGVRQPVLESGMGKLVPPGDPPALARAVLDVLSRKQRSYRRVCSWCRTLAPEAVAGSYETLFTRLMVRG